MTSELPQAGKNFSGIVKENCDNGQPAASGDLAEKYNFAFPLRLSANAGTEKRVYKTTTHFSRRVPQTKGFVFVNELMIVKLTLKEQDSLKRELVKLQMVHMEMGRRLTKLLSDHSQSASFALFENEISTMGLSNILNNPALPTEDAKEIAKFFDSLDEHAEKMMHDYSGKGPKAMIGKEIELSKTSDYSMIVSGLRLPSGKKGIIGLVGPKSMKYEKNMSLMEYIAKLLGGGAAVILLTIIK